MRKLIMTAAAFAVAMPVSMSFPTTSADAQYRGKSRQWVCTKRGGTTGALIGGAGGAVVGSAVGGTGATIAGGLLGAVAGRSIERSEKKRKCLRGYYRYR